MRLACCGAWPGPWCLAVASPRCTTWWTTWTKRNTPIDRSARAAFSAITPSCVSTSSFGAKKSQWKPSFDHHVQLFGRPPYLASADRGVYSAPNEAYAEQLGVKRVILPKPGYKSEARRQHERQRWFKRGRRFHAGVEGRISVLRRKHGLDRCLYHGDDGFGHWVGWGVIPRLG
jgi:hypothetical protein